jgi:energy-converting hydrogenase Eha subunit H
MWKYRVQLDRSQMTIKYDAEKMRFACRITKARLQTFSFKVFNTYCCSKAKMVTRSRFNFTLCTYLVGLVSLETDVLVGIRSSVTQNFKVQETFIWKCQIGAHESISTRCAAEIILVSSAQVY